jgi:MFS family permease
LFFVALWGRLVRIWGARPVLIAGYGSAAIGLVSTAVAVWWMPAIAPVLLIGAAFGASIIDGPGNIPFLRATRPHERPAMAGIYMTYRDISQFAPGAVFSLILAVAELTTAFLIFAAVLFGTAWLSRLINPRLR